MVGEVLNHAPVDLRMLDRFVLVALAETAQEKDRIARYESSAEAIADRIQSTAPSVRNALARLKQRGLIVPQLTKIHRGHAQQWLIPKLTESHRRATWDSATPELRVIHGTGQGKRNPGVARKAVDNS
jgi:hypothetical protein